MTRQEALALYKNFVPRVFASRDVVSTSKANPIYNYAPNGTPEPHFYECPIGFWYAYEGVPDAFLSHKYTLLNGRDGFTATAYFNKASGAWECEYENLPSNFLRPPTCRQTQQVDAGNASVPVYFAHRSNSQARVVELSINPETGGFEWKVNSYHGEIIAPGKTLATEATLIEPLRIHERTMVRDDLNAIFQVGISGFATKLIGTPTAWNSHLARRMHIFASQGLDGVHCGYPPFAEVFRSDGVRCVCYALPASLEDRELKSPDEMDFSSLEQSTSDKPYFQGNLWTPKEDRVGFAGYHYFRIPDSEIKWNIDLLTRKNIPSHNYALQKVLICKITPSRTLVGHLVPRFGWDTLGDGGSARVWVTEDSKGNDPGVTIMAGTSVNQHPMNDNEEWILPHLYTLVKGRTYCVFMETTSPQAITQINTKLENKLDIGNNDTILALHHPSLRKIMDKTTDKVYFDRGMQRMDFKELCIGLASHAGVVES